MYTVNACDLLERKPQKCARTELPDVTISTTCSTNSMAFLVIFWRIYETIHLYLGVVTQRCPIYVLVGSCRKKRICVKGPVQMSYIVYKFFSSSDQGWAVGLY